MRLKVNALFLSALLLCIYGAVSEASGIVFSRTGDEVCISAELTGEEKPAYMYVAEYSGGLEKLRCKSFNDNADSFVSIKTEAENEYIKAFVWNEKQQPLTERGEFNMLEKNAPWERTKYVVLADGVSEKVYNTGLYNFVQAVSGSEKIKFTVYYDDTIETVDIRPTVKSPEYTATGNMLEFYADTGCSLSVEINGNSDDPLFLFSNTLRTPPENSIIYRAGQTYDVGMVTVNSGQCVYIEKDAVVKGGFKAKDASQINILGDGIIDARGGNSCTFLQNCSDVYINGPVGVGGDAWLNKLYLCSGMKIENYKLLGSGTYSDGIDLLGCNNIEINNIFIRNEDDGIALKTSKYGFSGNISDISVSNAVIWSGASGNSLEIGYELDGDYVRNVDFSDIYVIHRGTKSTKFNRAAVSIHHAGNCEISDITYENVYVEESLEGLVHFAFFNMPSWGSGGGSIKNVTVRNMHYTGSENAPSYIKSVVSGVSLLCEDINFEGLVYDGVRVNSAEAAADCGFSVDSNADVTFR